jgi:hypothetical protein
VSHADLPPSVLWRNRQTEARLVLRPKPRNRRGDFEAQITKPKLPVLRPKPENPQSPWFWGSTKKSTTSFEAKPGEIVATSFEAKLEKTITAGFEAKLLETVTTGFEAKLLETGATSFKAKLEKTVTTGFEAKPEKTIATGFEAKPLETVTTGFEAKPVKTVGVVLRSTTHELSTLILRLNQETRAPRLHVHNADRILRHPTSRSPGHRVPDLCDHPRSSALGLLLVPWSSSLHAMPHLPPGHHEISKHNSPNETKIKEKQNKPFRTIKPRNWPLGFSLWVVAP